MTTTIVKFLSKRPGGWVSVICCFGVALSIPFVAVAQSPGPVAVMRFANLNQQLADDWIGVGIAETVASDLQSLGISVVGKAEVRDAVGEDQRAPGRFITDLTFLTASRAVGARWLVVGAYQRLGALIRITVRLVDVETGAVRRRGKVDGSLADIFLLQDQIVSILGGEIIRNRPVDDGAKVADVRVVVDRRAAAIDANPARIRRLERLESPGSGVVELHGRWRIVLAAQEVRRLYVKLGRALAHVKHRLRL
mgnify:CR=1 FL=1